MTNINSDIQKALEKFIQDKVEDLFQEKYTQQEVENMENWQIIAAKAAMREMIINLYKKAVNNESE